MDIKKQCRNSKGTYCSQCVFTRSEQSFAKETFSGFLKPCKSRTRLLLVRAFRNAISLLLPEDENRIFQSFPMIFGLNAKARCRRDQHGANGRRYRTGYDGSVLGTTYRHRNTHLTVPLQFPLCDYSRRLRQLRYCKT